MAATKKRNGAATARRPRLTRPAQGRSSAPLRTRRARKVAAGNPCPFLRALVALGALPDDVAELGDVAGTVVRIARAGDGEPELPRSLVYAIALVANGFAPAQVARTLLGGVRLDALRGGPFDKQGVGSRILDRRGSVDGRELERFAAFGTLKATGRGRRETGLDLGELRRMMDANFARAAGRRRPLDRLLMDGEWPVLLEVMGKEGRDGRYLSVADVRELFVARRLPKRMLERLAGAGVGRVPTEDRSARPPRRRLRRF
jgi:hypothetical protein